MNTSTSTPRASSLLPHAAISFRAGAWSLIAGVSLVVPMALLLSAMHLPAADAAMKQVSAARLAPLATHPWVLAAHALLIAPLYEEVLYRGLILQMLRRYLPLWFAVLVPTLLFAGIHLSFSYHNAVLAALVGLCSSWLVCRSNSLLPSMLCHAGVNLGTLFILRPLVLGAGWTSFHQVPFGWSALVIVGSVVGLFAAFRTLRAEFRSGVPALAVGSALPLTAA